VAVSIDWTPEKLSTTTTGCRNWSVLYTPFTRYNRLSKRLSNRFDNPVELTAACDLWRNIYIVLLLIDCDVSAVLVMQTAGQKETRLAFVIRRVELHDFRSYHFHARNEVGHKSHGVKLIRRHPSPHGATGNHSVNLLTLYIG